LSPDSMSEPMPCLPSSAVVGLDVAAREEAGLGERR
jgi:hypothetical protein